MNNKAIGNMYEKCFLSMLETYDYWAHLFAGDVSRQQPVDIIALKNNVAWLIDVKHCKENTFYFKNIQPNQLTCMELAREKGNIRLGFVIFFDTINQFKYMPYELYLKKVDEGKAGINHLECELLCL